MTTPTMLLICSSSLVGLSMRRLCTSRMMLPLSVSTCSRYTGSPPSLTSSRATWLRAIGITSTGSGKAPRIGTSLLASAMQTNDLATAATIFSRVSAAPPPLISSRRSLVSSAPST
ncbi:hypothetical protein D3C78_1601680 [compost metagenome]